MCVNATAVKGTPDLFLCCCERARTADRLAWTDHVLCFSLQTSTSNSYSLLALRQLTDLQCVDVGIVSNQPSDFQRPVAISKEIVPRNVPVMPITPTLCEEFLEDLDCMKDANENISLSLDQAHSILCKALPGSSVRVYSVPVLPV